MEVLILLVFIGAAPHFSIGIPIEQFTYPELEGDDFEGDIILDYTARNGLRPESYRWPDSEIPYIISEKFNKKQRAVLFKAMDHYHERTCIRFREKTDEDEDYIYIVKKKIGCSAQVGKRGGEQYVKLSSGCFSRLGTIVHEFMHAIGFVHEHSRSDRDLHVEIKYENIRKEKTKNFNKIKEENENVFGVKYDYGSVLHYSSTAFSVNGEDTIIPKKPGVTIGQRITLSNSDAKKINSMYKCYYMFRLNGYQLLEHLWGLY